MTTAFHRDQAKVLWLVYAAWCLVIGVASLIATAGAAQAKPFPVAQFSYYISDYDSQLKRLSLTVTKSETEIEADIAAAEAAGNARLTAAAIEQLLTKRPTDAALWLKLAQQLSAATPISDSDRWQIRSNIIGAALRAYSLVNSREDEAAALVIAANGFADRRSALQRCVEPEEDHIESSGCIWTSRGGVSVVSGPPAVGSPHRDDDRPAPVAAGESRALQTCVDDDHVCGA